MRTRAGVIVAALLPMSACDFDFSGGGGDATDPEVCDLGWEEACNEEGFLCEDPADPAPTRTVFVDGDGDGFGDPTQPFEVTSDAETPEGASSIAGDCDDDSAAQNPSAFEDDDCGDGIDADCDGLVDCDDWDCRADAGCAEVACAEGSGLDGSGAGCLPTGTINSARWATLVEGDGPSVEQPNAGDIDGDGFDDRVEERDGQVWVSFGDGAGGYGDDVWLRVSESATTFGILSADQDYSGDGIDDVVVRYARYVRVFFGRARTESADWAPDVTIAEDCRARAAEVVPNVDFDGDGDVDLVLLLDGNASPCTSCFVEPGMFVFESPLSGAPESFDDPWVTFAQTRELARVRGRGVSINAAIVLEGDGRLWPMLFPIARASSLEGLATLGDDGTGVMSFFCDVDGDERPEVVSVGGSRLVMRTLDVGDTRMFVGDATEVALPAVTAASGGLAGLGPDACLPDLNGDGLAELSLFSFAPVGFAPGGIHVRYSPWAVTEWTQTPGFSVTDATDFVVDLDVAEGSGGAIELVTTTFSGTRRRQVLD